MEWISVKDEVPGFDRAVRVWNDDGYSPNHQKEVIARRVKTNNNGDWYWYQLDMHNTLLDNVTHFAWQVPPTPQGE